MDNNQNPNQETAAEAQERASYIRSLVRPSAGGNKSARKAWSIDLETFWVPFFTATTVSGDKVMPLEALGAPLRLAKDTDGGVKFSKSGKPVIRVVKEIADGVKLVRENLVANGLAYIQDVRKSNPDSYKATIQASLEAGSPIIARQDKDLAEAILKREQAEREEAEAAAARATAKASKGKSKLPVAA